AVENHMPEVVVIDEIGTEQEAAAARTIAERGVQLIATAHGNTIENLMLNPTLTDLVGGIQTVTLSDEEARRRGTQKSVLERKAPPTFQVLVEIQAYQRVAVSHDVSQVVDPILLGIPSYIARSNSSSQIASALASVIDLRRGPEDQALEEAREAIEAVASGQSDEIELAPQNAYVRRLQHELAERASLSSRSTGHD